MDLREVGWGAGLDRSGLEKRQVADSCECGNNPWGSIKSGEFFEQLLRKDCAPWSQSVLFGSHSQALVCEVEIQAYKTINGEIQISARNGCSC